MKTTLVENRIAEEIEKVNIPGLKGKRFEVEVDADRGEVRVMRNPGLNGPDMSFKFTASACKANSKVVCDVNIEKDASGKVKTWMTSPERIEAIKASTIMDTTPIMDKLRLIVDEQFFTRMGK